MPISSKEPGGVFYGRLILGFVFTIGSLVTGLAIFAGPVGSGAIATVAFTFVLLATGFLLVSYTVEWFMRELIAALPTPESRRAEIRKAMVEAAKKARHVEMEKVAE
jgi:hypothetical protein